jgi:hypothetical protein
LARKTSEMAKLRSGNERRIHVLRDGSARDVTM